MSNASPTILDLKTSFLRTQINALSQPLSPSPNWESRIPDSAEGTASNQPRQRSIDDAIQKLNLQLKRHARLSYAPQASRHVAEQIDRLYWKAGERGLQVVSGGGEEWSERGVDFRQQHIINQLPALWSEEANQRAPEEASRYAELQQRLVELNEKRELARQRVRQYQALKELLAPLEDGAQVQENIVTRNGEVEQELERMRMLMVRVERGLGALDRSAQEEEEMEIDGDEQAKKVNDFIAGL